MTNHLLEEASVHCHGLAELKPSGSAPLAEKPDAFLSSVNPCFNCILPALFQSCQLYLCYVNITVKWVALLLCLSMSLVHIFTPDALCISWAPPNGHATHTCFLHCVHSPHHWAVHSMSNWELLHKIYVWCWGSCINDMKELWCFLK